MWILLWYVVFGILYSSATIPLIQNIELYDSDNIPSVNNLDSCTGASMIKIQWWNHEFDIFHKYWLLDNIVDHIHFTGQKITRINNIRTTPNITQVLLIDPKIQSQNYSALASSPRPRAQLAIHFSDGQQHIFTQEFLYRHRGSAVLRRPTEKTYPVVVNTSNDDNNDDIGTDTTILKFDYHQLINEQEQQYLWLECLIEYGLCIIENAPSDNENVLDTLGKLGLNGIIDTLYGKTWHVHSHQTGAENDINSKANIAYTKESLSLHQDLTYFESPPGIQLLHVMEFDDTVKGGHSLFLDTLPLLKYFRQYHPEEFRIFTIIPVTFQKDAINRDFPQQLFYRKPHIILNDQDEIIDFAWSPPFEGPLQLSNVNDVITYYKAREVFEQVLLAFEESHMLKFRSQVGYILTWNNKRILHGRSQINGHGVRHLHGAYMNLDYVLSRYLTLKRLKTDDEQEQYLMNENQLWMTHCFNRGY